MSNNFFLAPTIKTNPLIQMAWSFYPSKALFPKRIFVLGLLVISRVPLPLILHNIHHYAFCYLFFEACPFYD
jgi:hypothetical protein